MSDEAPLIHYHRPKARVGHLLKEITPEVTTEPVASAAFFTFMQQLQQREAEMNMWPDK